MPNYITKEGLKKLKEKLNYLREELRPEIIKRVQTAREMGDLSENAEYKAAREEQRNCDNEIDSINRKMPNMKVIDPDSLSKDAARFGALVTAENENSETEVFCLVGVDEVNFYEDEEIRYISIASPIGKAFLGKKKGDTTIVKAPIGDKKYKIKNIK